MEKPVSKFAFEVRKLRRYSAAEEVRRAEAADPFGAALRWGFEAGFRV